MQGDLGLLHLNLLDILAMAVTAGFNVVAFDAFQPVALSMLLVIENDLGSAFVLCLEDMLLGWFFYLGTQVVTQSHLSPDEYDIHRRHQQYRNN